jgi:hypothetical protein
MSDHVLSLFKGTCGHQWVGATDGSFACPVCGLHEGDHYLVSMDPIAVQVDDWGTDTWATLAADLTTGQPIADAGSEAA